MSEPEDPIEVTIHGKYGRGPMPVEFRDAFVRMVQLVKQGIEDGTIGKERRHCEAVVWVRDISRYSGRGRGGFSLHYRRQTCKRFVGAGHRLCWQHRRATVPSEPTTGGQACGT